MLYNTRALLVGGHVSICLGSHPHQEGLRARGHRGHTANTWLPTVLLFP